MCCIVIILLGFLILIFVLYLFVHRCVCMFGWSNDEWILPITKGGPIKMHWSVMGELYACFKKNWTCFNHFDIKRSIAQTNKTYLSLDSPAHKEYQNPWAMSVEWMRQVLRRLIQDVIEIKCFIVISLMKQIFFLVRPMDIRIKLLLDWSDR